MKLKDFINDFNLYAEETHEQRLYINDIGIIATSVEDNLGEIIVHYNNFTIAIVNKSDIYNMWFLQVGDVIEIKPYFS